MSFNFADVISNLKLKNQYNKMKKLLGLLLFATAMFSSCGNDLEDLYDPHAAALLKANKYSKAFVQQFGAINPNHTWGFSGLMPRAAETGANEFYYNWHNPGNITEVEREKVLAEFSKKREGAVNTIIIDAANYWVQQVHKGTETYKNADGNLVNNGNTAAELMNLLKAYNAQHGYYEHISNFNQGNNTNKVVSMHGSDTLGVYTATTLMKDMGQCTSATTQFGFENSLDGNKFHTTYLILEIDGAYYVGFDYISEGDSNDKKVERDWIFNDWIVKIIPAVDVNTEHAVIISTSRIIAEDLGEIGDFDFNDVVFDVELVQVQKSHQIIDEYANVTLVAAGGTLPLYIAGKEVHELFGVSVNTMVNTGLGVQKDVVPFRIDGCTNVLDILVEVEDDNGRYTLDAALGKAAKKICVSTNYEITEERQRIDEKYPKFKEYVNNPAVKWY